MRSIVVNSVLAIAASVVLVGCAGDGTNLLTTGAVTPQKQIAAAPVDPACLALQNRISLLRGEGTVSRVEKAASGKSKTVVLKRAALSKVAELNQANAEFQSRCSKLPRSAAVTPQPAILQQAAAAAARERALKSAAGQARTALKKN